jgi:hypothetical protein
LAFVQRSRKKKAKAGDVWSVVDRDGAVQLTLLDGGAG